MDGLLLDTENLYTQGTQQILSQYNKTYSWEFKTKLMGKRTDEVARMIIEHYQLPLTPEEWITKSRDIYNDLFPKVKSLPGVTKLVHHLAKHKIPISVASSSSSSAFQLKSENHSGLFSLFDNLVLGDNELVKNAKPAPDIFIVAAENFKKDGIDAEDCLVVEDAPLGVAAGKAAGMQVLMVPDLRMDEANRKEATLALNSLDEFDPRDFGLPGFGYTPVTHVIFDMDGLLLNTQTMYSQVSAKILAQLGKTPDWDFKMKVIGRQASEVADMAVAHYSLPYTGQEYLEMHQAELYSMFPSCSLLPGVEKLVRHLHAHNISMGVATSSTKKVMDIKISSKHSDFFSLFNPIVTGCNPTIKQAKPSPEIYQLCASMFSSPPSSPSSCLVLEDAPNGVQAGLAAGMQVVMIPHNKVKKEYLMPATQVLATMEHFRPQDFGLPAY
eukprot:TRINITY_DN12544_c0_g1_i1.p1 TRINITY_DN12544_c0_g1~~TRINITY_DN12544_c0_g1_i1.p1  ORF type:complete len:468 (-),score=148.35 TRINITY_DN12544_c0_g1_i1:66-1388(-)